MTEDKAYIAGEFAKVLQLTDAYQDLIDLTYHKDDDEEVVVADFQNGWSKKINVHWDSGIAMIRDILKGLEDDK